jgi:hypothetical protein
MEGPPLGVGEVIPLVIEDKINPSFKRRMRFSSRR